MVAISPNLCLLQRSLSSNSGGVDPEKLYLATLNSHGTFQFAAGTVAPLPSLIKKFTRRVILHPVLLRDVNIFAMFCS